MVAVWVETESISLVAVMIIVTKAVLILAVVVLELLDVEVFSSKDWKNIYGIFVESQIRHFALKFMKYTHAVDKYPVFLKVYKICIILRRPVLGAENGVSLH